MIFLIFVVIVVALSLLEALTTQNNKFLMCNDFAWKTNNLIENTQQNRRPQVPCIQIVSKLVRVVCPLFLDQFW